MGLERFTSITLSFTPLENKVLHLSIFLTSFIIMDEKRQNVHFPCIQCDPSPLNSDNCLSLKGTGQYDITKVVRINKFTQNLQKPLCEYQNLKSRILKMFYSTTPSFFQLF